MKTKPLSAMATFIKCKETGLSFSYAYKKGCRCVCCKGYKSQERLREGDKPKIRARAWRLKNPDRSRANAKSYQKRHPEKVLEWRLRNRYGITVETYNNLLEKQNHVCAICFQKPKHRKRLAVDHCHGTGKIRGLLCMDCNLALGLMKDSTEMLDNCIKYLKENGDVYHVWNSLFSTKKPEKP